MKTWIDIENPPQVQYLAPFKAALEARGHPVIVTARDQGLTLDLLGRRGIDVAVVGGASGSSRAGKALNVVARAGRLAHTVTRGGRPGVLIASSRPSNLAAWGLRVPSFQFTDYEHSHSTIARHTGTYLLYPDVIASKTLTAQGYRSDRLMPFAGLKEAISFGGVDIAEIEPCAFPGLREGLITVLFRPPGEAAHYFVQESLDLTLDLLGQLAARDDVVTVYLPRYSSQRQYLDRYRWENAPIVPTAGIPFIPLLKASDAVISSGGTMLREAAFLGIPAFSVLRSEIGQVDRYLESIGRLTILESGSDFRHVTLRRASLDPLPSRTKDLVGELTDKIVALASDRRQ